MEAENSEGKCSRKLDFSAPLLSTRRPSTPRLARLPSSNDNPPIPLQLDVSKRIPFSWEQIPGKPKEQDDDDDDQTSDDDDVPLPKPPPGKWYPRSYVVESRSDCDCYEQGRHCDNYDGDVEDAAGNRELLYSDALDVFSLGESSLSDNVVNSNNNVGTTGTMFLGTGGNFEPDLIFLRFLKDAKALAADSAINNESDLNELYASDQPESCFARALSVRQRFDSPCSKACGLDILLPWRMKPKPCGGTRNSVVVAASPRLKPQYWGNRKTQDHV